MKLSTKGRYAMVALCDIALQPRDELVTLSDISRRQDISLAYLEQLFVKLRRSGLVESVRGPGGGYKLSKSTHEIRVVDILSAVDETIDALHKGAGAQGGQSGQQGPIPQQPHVGRVKRACLCLSASNTACPM
jgi:Rrf2 family iron-sulfur cluster assembly transcriptional regulator